MEPSVLAFFTFLQKSPFNMMLFGTAVVTGGMLVWPLFGRLAGGSASQVGVFDAVQLINRRDALIIDVRDKADYAAGHVPNSRHIPLADLAGRLGELEKFKTRPVIVNCAPGAAVGEGLRRAQAGRLQGGFCPAWRHDRLGGGEPAGGEINGDDPHVQHGRVSVLRHGRASAEVQGCGTSTRSASIWIRTNAGK